MWHEARRQERKIRGMLVDYRRRAERRRDFYEKIKADPTQFLQLHGRQCKIHLDPAIAAAADSAAAMMPWQNQPDNLIDRFDVRAHLDFIPPVSKENEEELLYEERQLNYERYRIIAQNSFLNINEEKFLKQLHLEEQFGYTESEPKKKKSTGAAIGFNYEDGTAGPAQPETNDNASDANSDSDLDVDLSINISKIDQLQAHEMNRHGRNFGMSSNDFYSFLTNDLEEAENYRQAREEEHEKALFSGRKSRRERRAHREKRLANRVISPPSYAARSSPTYPSFRESKSASRSPSPEVAEKITYITSFGDEEEPTTSKPTYADKVKHGRPKTYPKTSSSERTVYRSTRRSRDRDKSYRKRRRSSSSRSPKFKTRGSRSRETSRRSRSVSTDRYKTTTRSRTRRSVRSRKSSSDSSSSSKSKSKSRSSSSGGGSSSSVVSKGKRSVSPTSGEKEARKESPPKAIPRYYGRKRSDQSSSDSGEGSDEEKNGNQPESNHPAVGDRQTSSGNSGSSIKKTSGPSLSLQERLKRKRQALLNKQFKADKIAEQLKSEREKQEQQHREDELRELALKLRRRQREIRHAYDTNSSSSSESDEKETSPVPTVENKPRSRSASPRSSRGHHSERRESRRERSKERRERNSSPAYVIRRSPKRYEVVKRVVYRDEGTDRGYRSSSSSRRREENRRDEQRRDGRDEQRRESRRDDCKSNRALVDY